MQSPNGREFGGILAMVLVVSAGTAATLRALDALPTLLLGEPHGISRHRSIDDAARVLGVRPLLPVYFPDTLRWPPSSIRMGRVPEVGLGIQFSGPNGGPERLLLFQTPPGGREFPFSLVPEARAFYQVGVTIAGEPGTFRSVRAGSDGTFAEVEFSRAGRRILIRYAGPGDELMKIANSLQEAR